MALFRQLMACENKQTSQSTSLSPSLPTSLTHRNVLLLSKEAHADVVPEVRGLGSGGGRHAVLAESHVKVPTLLHQRACCQDGLDEEEGGSGEGGGGSGEGAGVQMIRIPLHAGGQRSERSPTSPWLSVLSHSTTNKQTNKQTNKHVNKRPQLTSPPYLEVEQSKRAQQVRVFRVVPE